MHEPTHTPGPWINDGGIVYGKNTELVGAPSFDIYDAQSWPGHAEEAQANAKLIAAAPELLEALQHVLECMSQIPDDVMDVIISAIRKATQ